MKERSLQIIVHWIPGTKPNPIVIGEWDDSVREAVIACLSYPQGNLDDKSEKSMI